MVFKIIMRRTRQPARQWVRPGGCGVLALFCSLCLSQPDMARAQQSLSLEEAVALAMAQNPGVQATAAATKGASERMAQARAGYLPEVNYSESLQYGNNPVYVFGALLEQHRFRSSNFDIGKLNRPDPLTNFSSQLTASQTVFDGNKTRHRLRSAQVAADMAGERNRQAEMDVLLEVAEAYYAAVLAQENQRVAEEDYRTAQVSLERAEAMRDAGMTTDADVLALRVRRAEVEDQRIRARNQLALALARLNDVLAVPLETRHSLSTPLGAPLASTSSPAKLGDYENLALRQRPEAREADMAVNLAETDFRLARAALLPELAIHGTFEANRQTFGARGASDWMAGATLRLNLFRGFADRARIAESSFLKTQREQERQRAQSALRLEVRQSFLDLESAGSRIQTALSAVAEAEENHRIMANRYEAGLSTVTELLRSQSALSAAKLRHLGAVFDQRVAAVRLEHDTGSLNPSSDVLKP